MDIFEKPDFGMDTSENDAKHYGMPRRSGRYPWGSGKEPYQSSNDFLSRFNELKKQGYTEKEIGIMIGNGDPDYELTTTDLRRYKTIAVHEDKMRKLAAIKSMKGDGYTDTEIANKLGLAGESTVRMMIKADMEHRLMAGQKTAEILKAHVDEKGMIDVSKGVELELGVSRTKFDEALTILNEEGYELYNRGEPNVTMPGKQTITSVLCPPGTTYGEAYKGEVHTINDYITYDDGDSFHKAFIYPSSMDSKRLKVRYAEEGGLEKDGLVEVRRGVADLSLGNANYSQVRIMVDGTHYIKGMAVYSDGSDMPDGVDVIFNTNKSLGTPVTAAKGEKCVLKEIKSDPDNPFGSLIKEHGGQSFYDDPNGKYTDPLTGKKQSLSLINKRADEGDWGEWSKSLPSQFLSKQNQQLIDKQLNLAIAGKKEEFDEIMKLNNPAIKKKMLSDFADDCDTQATELKAAALPGQRYQVILPVPSLTDKECFAPNYNDGDQVALIRYPHGGTFEIPILKVNNKNAEALKTIGNSAKDAVGINAKTATKLSGADFDGDTVMVIPISKGIKINSRDQLKGLKDFDPHAEYAYREGMKIMAKDQTGREMGKITNLITDMSLQGATDDELARAVRHSMVVIDANKHKLDYRRSEEENGITALKKKYQAHADGTYGGASTLLSLASSEAHVTHRVGSPKINNPDKYWYNPDKPIGSIVYTEKETTYVKKGKNGKETVQRVTDTVSKMSVHDDARELISAANTPQERAYAKFANELKNLANTARVAVINTPSLKKDKSATEKYAPEVKNLSDQLISAQLNANRERAAQRLANQNIRIKKEQDPSLENDKATLKKLKQQELTKARLATGAKGVHINLTDREYEAIQAGALSESMLNQVLIKCDPDRLRELATPKTNTRELTTAQKNLIKAMSSSGYTNAEIAERLMVSSSTIVKYA